MADAQATRVATLELALAQLEEAAATHKLQLEEQTAALNAKELLLARKSEHVEELQTALSTLGERLAAQTREMQALTARRDELRVELRQSEHEFDMLSAALDTRTQALEAAAERERLLRQELERAQTLVRRLERSVESLQQQPEVADACLSPRSFQENQLIRLRDDALEAKTRELWLLSGQNDQLRAQLDALETALQQLQSSVAARENDVVRRQRQVDRLESELEALQASRSQAQGREQAMEVATAQNAKLLQALEAQERAVGELQTKLQASERECQQLREAQRQQRTLAAESEVESQLQTRQTQEQAALLDALQLKLSRERQTLSQTLAETQLEHQMQLAKTHSELVLRRNKQYELSLRLQDVEARLHSAEDGRESAQEQLAAAVDRMHELERVLSDALERKTQLETQLQAQQAAEASAATQQSAKLAETQREVGVLRQQLAKQDTALAARVTLEKQHALELRELQQLLDKQRQRAQELQERVGRLVHDVNREAQARAAAELERTLLRDQLETQRAQAEVATRERLQQAQQAEERRQKLEERLAQLAAEFRVVQSARAKLLVKFVNVWGRAPAFASDTDVLELRECGLVDADLQPLLRTLEDTSGERLRRVDLRGNRLTSEAMGRLVAFLKRLATRLVHGAAGIHELDLRQNCISLDGVRAVASGLETLVSRRDQDAHSDSDGSSVLQRVVASDDGRIECFATASGQQEAPLVPVLVVDVSGNTDADWLVSEARQLQQQLRRRRSKPSHTGDGDTADSSNNRSGAMHLLQGSLRSGRDAALEEIYGLDLVSVFMGSDKPDKLDKLAPASSSKTGSSTSGSRRRRTSVDANPALALPSPASRVSSEVTITSSSPRTSDSRSGSSACLTASVSLPKLSG